MASDEEALAETVSNLEDMGKDCGLRGREAAIRSFRRPDGMYTHVWRCLNLEAKGGQRPTRAYCDRESPFRVISYICSADPRHACLKIHTFLRIAMGDGGFVRVFSQPEGDIDRKDRSKDGNEPEKPSWIAGIRTDTQKIT